MAAKRRVVVVGGGVFGLSAALELSARGDSVTVIDASDIPAPNAASTDISKILRMDYGADTLYASMMLEAFERWDEWNARWGAPVFYREGFLLLTRDTMRPGSLEFDSLQVQQQLGMESERITPGILRERYPAWNADVYKDGYFNARAGWAESGRVVSLLRQDAEAAGVRILERLRVTALSHESSRVTGVRTADGAVHSADVVIVAAGTWSPQLCEHLRPVLRHVAQPVFHFRPEQPELFRAAHFPVWSADIGRTGFYGFPLHRDGVVKVANHGPGRELDPDTERATTEEDELDFRRFLERSLPALANAPVAASRLCFYSDSWDGDFYIGADPEYHGLFHTTGGSGHGFKFAPILGVLLADVIDQRPNPYAARFAWRQRGAARKEQARFQGDPLATARSQR